MRIWAAAIAMMVVTACAETVTVTAMDKPATGSFATELNAFRSGQGQGSVAPDSRLQRAALAHANDMERRGYFAHQSPDGGTMSARIAASGYRACAAAENIAQGQKTEAAVFAAWRDSAGHRRNMLGARYADYGLGRSGDTWVLLLGAGC